MKSGHRDFRGAVSKDSKKIPEKFRRLGVS